MRDPVVCRVEDQDIVTMQAVTRNDTFLCSLSSTCSACTAHYYWHLLADHSCWWQLGFVTPDPHCYSFKNEVWLRARELLLQITSVVFWLNCIHTHFGHNRSLPVPILAFWLHARASWSSLMVSLTIDIVCASYLLLCSLNELRLLPVWRKRRCLVFVAAFLNVLVKSTPLLLLPPPLLPLLLRLRKQQLVSRIFAGCFATESGLVLLLFLSPSI